MIGLENEHACNVGTGAEAARMLAAVDHPALGRDLGSGERLDPRRDAVPGRLRDCSRTNASSTSTPRTASSTGHTPTWGPLGEMAVDWRGQIAALVRDGYTGAISLETHWRGPNGDRLEASTICGRNLRALVSA